MGVEGNNRITSQTNIRRILNISREMRNAKFSNDIERVAFYYAYDFFKQSPRLLWYNNSIQLYCYDILNYTCKIQFNSDDDDDVFVTFHITPVCG